MKPMRLLAAAALPLLFAVALPARAQSPQEVQAERARIAAERSRIEAAYQEAQKACYRKFAVSDCINEARGLRNDQLADLRRQEIHLNDADRKRRTAERLRELEDRQSQQQQEQQGQAREKALSQQQSREDRAAEKAAASAQAASAARERAQKAARPRERKDPVLPDAAENARRHEERLKEAREHRAKVEKRQAEAKNPPKPSLPVPP
jgi:hypothetical protein